MDASFTTALEWDQPSVIQNSATLKTDLDQVKKCWERVSTLGTAKDKLEQNETKLIEEVAKLRQQKTAAEHNNKYLDQKLMEAKFSEATLHQKEEECTKRRRR